MVSLPQCGRVLWLSRTGVTVALYCNDDWNKKATPGGDKQYVTEFTKEQELENCFP